MSAGQRMTAHCRAQWADEVGHDAYSQVHECLHDPSRHLRHVCSCGAQMIEDAEGRGLSH